MIASLQMAVLEWTDQCRRQRRRHVLHHQSALREKVRTSWQKRVFPRKETFDFASLRLCVKTILMLVCGQRAMGVITARCEWSTIVAKVKLSFGLR